MEKKKINQTQKEINPLDARNLYYGELICMQPGEEIIVDDCSGGILNLSSQFASFYGENSSIHVQQLEELNTELAELLENYQNGQLDPKKTLYILPGGGGQRLALSLEEYGMYMPNKINITVERPTNEDGTKGNARVSEESMNLLTPDILEGRDIVVLDDAINAGGTLVSIRDAIATSSGGAVQNRLIAAAPIRFSVPEQNGNTIEYGVPGYDAVIASKVIYGPDTDQSSPVTFLSSFLKREPAKDARLLRIAEKAGRDAADVIGHFSQIKTIYQTYLLNTEGYKPENPATVRLAELFATMQDSDAILNFLRAILTASEIADITQRFEIAEQLDKNYSIHDIVDNLGVSSKTATRVKFWYERFPQGYQEALKNKTPGRDVDENANSWY